MVHITDLLGEHTEPSGRVSRILEGYYHENGSTDDTYLDEKDCLM